ncbi:MAG: hypothetical protein K1X74_09675 [Pirellulales bacterium]|nr:hypothetical protein [Pirellulales bacterium]
MTVDGAAEQAYYPQSICICKHFASTVAVSFSRSIAARYVALAAYVTMGVASYGWHGPAGNCGHPCAHAGPHLLAAEHSECHHGPGAHEHEEHHHGDSEHRSGHEHDAPSDSPTSDECSICKLLSQACDRNVTTVVLHLQGPAVDRPVVISVQVSGVRLLTVHPRGPPKVV